MYAYTAEQVRAQAHARQRVMIQPRVSVKAGTDEQRRAISHAAQKVIHEHREVLVALKNR